MTEKLQREITKVLAQGFEPFGSTAEQLAQRIRDDTATYAAIVKATGAQAD